MGEISTFSSELLLQNKDMDLLVILMLEFEAMFTKFKDKDTQSY